MEVAKPMTMQHNIVVDDSINEDTVQKIVIHSKLLPFSIFLINIFVVLLLLLHSQEACVQFYKDLPDRICFDDLWLDNTNLLNKLKASLLSKLRNENDMIIVDFLEEHLLSKAKKFKLDSSPLPTKDGAADVVVAAATTAAAAAPADNAQQSVCA